MNKKKYLAVTVAAAMTLVALMLLAWGYDQKQKVNQLIEINELAIKKYQDCNSKLEAYVDVYGKDLLLDLTTNDSLVY